MKHILKAGTLEAGGHYALATIAGDLMFVSGLLPTRPGRDHALVTAPFADQMTQVFAHLDAILAEAEATRDQVAKLSVYLADITHWPECNTLCARYFADSRPARCIVPVPTLHYGYLLEIEAVVHLTI
ncbi:RidA family protein [Niveispirillum sp. KHB5.9]|uniref:RidA family protein n=1 Tax=Niveispirillum sp. KHB5.9 TaxID=3400269 RepID=UPI003A85496F